MCSSGLRYTSNLVEKVSVSGLETYLSTTSLRNFFTNIQVTISLTFPTVIEVLVTKSGTADIVS